MSGAKKLEEIDLARAGSQITIDRIKNHKELYAQTEKEGDEKFLQKTRELWEFAVHGKLKKDKNGNIEKGSNGEPVVLPYADLDGKCSLELLKKAGFNNEALEKSLKYVPQGGNAEGRVNIDTGNKHGVVVEGNTAYIDHHAKESKWGTSASAITYNMLLAMGLLEKNERLDHMVEFATKMDNGDYPGIENYFKNSWKTMAGLERFISRPMLVKFFMEDKNPDPTRELSEGELRKYGFIVKDKNIDRSGNQKAVAEKSQERLQQMEKDGLIVPSDRYGKIAISIESGDGVKDLPGDYLAARAFGCDVYVIWNPKENRFKISSKTPIAEKYAQGMSVRETMWIKNNKDNSELDVSLGEILTKMIDGKLAPEGKLKQYLDNPEAFLKENDQEKINKKAVEYFADVYKKFVMEIGNENEVDWSGSLPKEKSEISTNLGKAHLRKLLKQARGIQESDIEEIIGKITEKTKV